jgi:hypothetical protein
MHALFCVVKGKVCTLVQALKLCTGHTTPRGSRGVALLFHDHGTRRGGVRGLHHAPAGLYSGKDPVSIVQEFGWAPGSVWTGAENLALTGIRFPDRPARSQSLPGPLFCAEWYNIMIKFSYICLSVSHSKTRRFETVTFVGLSTFPEVWDG